MQIGDSFRLLPVGMGANCAFTLPLGFAMGLAPPSSFLRRLVARRRASRDVDPADMGTAFGLEASLGPVSAYPDKSGAWAGGATHGEDTPMGWLGRRLNRRR